MNSITHFGTIWNGRLYRRNRFGNKREQMSLFLFHSMSGRSLISETTSENKWTPINIITSRYKYSRYTFDVYLLLLYYYIVFSATHLFHRVNDGRNFDLRPSLMMPPQYSSRDRTKSRAVRLLRSSAVISSGTVYF